MKEKLLEITNSISKLMLIKEEDSNDLQKEMSIVRIALKDLEWNSMTDSEKHDKRKFHYNSLLKLHESKTGPSVLEYEFCAIELYELIENCLNQLRNHQPIEEHAILLLRLQAMLLIEKMFMNEKKDLGKVRHNDYYVFTMLLEKLVKIEIFATLALDVILAKFVQMYKLWDRRPYKEVG